MKTGLKKSQKTTEIFFDEASRWITVNTYNTDLKNRLTAYAKKYPDLCRLTDDTEDGGLSFEIAKGRFCFRLTEPYSDERRAAASEYAKKQNNQLRNQKTPAEGCDGHEDDQRRAIGCGNIRRDTAGRCAGIDRNPPFSSEGNPVY